MVNLEFNNYIGIDYSGAKTSLSRLAQLQIYAANPESNPKRINPPEKGGKNWCLKELTLHLKEILKTNLFHYISKSKMNFHLKNQEL